MTTRNRGPWANPFGAEFGQTESLVESYRVGDVVTHVDDTGYARFYYSWIDFNKDTPGHTANWLPLGDPPRSVLAPTGIKSETFSRAGCSLVDLANTNFASGQEVGQAISLKAGDSVNYIYFAVGATAMAGVSHHWVALRDVNGNLLAQSNDNTTFAMASASLSATQLSSPYLITATGLYYIGIMNVATTMPSLLGISVASGIGLIASDKAPQLGITMPASGLTTTAPSTGTPGGSLRQLYGGISP